MAIGPANLRNTPSSSIDGSATNLCNLSPDGPKNSKRRGKTWMTCDTFVTRREGKCTIIPKRLKDLPIPGLGLGNLLIRLLIGHEVLRDLPSIDHTRSASAGGKILACSTRTHSQTVSDGTAHGSMVVRKRSHHPARPMHRYVQERKSTKKCRIGAGSPVISHYAATRSCGIVNHDTFAGGYPRHRF